MKNKILIAAALIVCTIASSCNDWLDVTPQAQVNADKLFSTPEGYESAVYGIYTAMTDASIYGTHMTFGFMDVLAQYYGIYNNNNHDLNECAKYNYDNGTAKNLISDIWLKSYNTIANCNVLLERLKKQSPTFFPEGEYDLIYGEVLALRAFLHFDLLRAFAPSWKVDKEALCLPYADNFTDKIHRQKKTSEIVQALIHDLDTARILLKPVDRALEESFKEMDYNNPHYMTDMDNVFLSARAYRMNYWAVTGLLARVYHYMGDPKAYTYANEVIQALRDGYFRFTQENELSMNDKKKRDVIMQNEVLFALNYSGIHDLWYSYDASQNTAYEIDRASTLYPSGNDFRGQYLVIDGSRTSAKVSIKYADVKAEKGEKIPMIRMSEMFLIAAESGFDQDKENAISLLEELRLNRGIGGEISSTISAEKFREELTIEARREFLGEGQMFYWYKRLGVPVGLDEIEVSPATFCLPLPATEVEFGNRAGDYIKNLK